jgi:hypothetical protein
MKRFIMAEELTETRSLPPGDWSSLFSVFEEMIRSPLNTPMEKAIDQGQIPIGYT